MSRRGHLQRELRQHLSDVRRAVYALATDSERGHVRAQRALASLAEIERLCAPRETEDEQLGPRCCADGCEAPADHRNESGHWNCTRHALEESIELARVRPAYGHERQARSVGEAGS